MAVKAQRSSTNGNHSFAQVPAATIPRSVFNRSSGLKTTFDSGDLIPIWCDEALPGDTINLSCATFARMATPLHPIMDNQYLDLFWFAVPMRLLWDNWQKFMGEQTSPGDSTDYLLPQISSGATSTTGSLHDHMGIPPGINGLLYSAMWHRAYNLIWTEWFRDQNLQDAAFEEKGDGPTSDVFYNIKKRGKRHDYFTSCLPFPQKGDPVALPFVENAPVVGVGGAVPSFNVGGQMDQKMTGDGFSSVTWTPNVNINTDSGAVWNTTGLETDLGNATAVTINDLRTATRIQRLLEKDARGGTRYTEVLRSHFGVTSPDARQMRPEYLGGGTAQIQVNPVPQTSSTDAGVSPQGNMAAYVTSSNVGRGFNKSFTEHCVIIGLASIRADISYQQGLARMFSRQTRYDFYWPSFAHLGEQGVLNKEIYAQGIGDPGVDDEIFGYQERYAEYRYKASQISGEMRSSAAQSLDTWHLAQEFSSLPLLNSNFIQEDPPMGRITAVPSEPDWLFDAWFNVKHVRPIPTYAIPGMSDHF